MKAWVVQNRYEGYCVLIHAETAGKAKADACGYMESEFTEVNATRLPGLDDKEITYENAKEAGFRYTNEWGDGDYDEDQCTYYMTPEEFTNYCNCEICKAKAKVQC